MSPDDREYVLKQLEYAVDLIRREMDPRQIPEVGMNIVYALPDAREPADVAGVEGRMVRLKGAVHPVGEVAFGASNHIARIVLTAMRFNPEIRSAANIRFSDPAVRMFEELLFEVRSFDRTKEPEGVKTMDWGVAFCCEGGVPDIIFDRGAMGKEPMIRILGESPVTVAHNIIMLSSRIKNTNL
ncbi:MAG: thiamine-phosphate synthase family protein [Euryarchaeota archaeon]|nr:thiamine-phosphate synthase family protein [Euryarchaeota archaeon]